MDVIVNPSDWGLRYSVVNEFALGISWFANVERVLNQERTSAWEKMIRYLQHPMVSWFMRRFEMTGSV